MNCSKHLIGPSRFRQISHPGKGPPPSPPINSVHFVIHSFTAGDVIDELTPSPCDFMLIPTQMFSPLQSHSIITSTCTWSKEKAAAEKRNDKIRAKRAAQVQEPRAQVQEPMRAMTWADDVRHLRIKRIAIFRPSMERIESVNRCVACGVECRQCSSARRTPKADATTVADGEHVVSEEVETAQAEVMVVKEREEVEIGETPLGVQKENSELVSGAEEMGEELNEAPSGAEEVRGSSIELEEVLNRMDLQEERERAVPNEEVAEGFANGGFSEGSEMDFQVRDPTPLPLEDDAKEPNKYLICQTHPKGIIGGKLKGPGPFFMWIPDELVKRDLVRLLQIGDTAVISDWKMNEKFSNLSHDMNPTDGRPSWLVQGRINTQASALKVKEIKLSVGFYRPGIITSINRYRGGGFKSATVVAAQLLCPLIVYARQLTKISQEGLRVNQVVYLEVTKITSPQEWWQSESYILPNITPFRKGDEKKAHESLVVIGMKECSESFRFPLDQFSERLMGAAAAAQRCFEEEKLAKQAVNVTLSWTRPQVRPEELQKRLSRAQLLSFEWTLETKAAVADFVEAWEEDTPVRAKVAHDNEAQFCARGRVLDVAVREDEWGTMNATVRMLLAFEAKKGYGRGWTDWESILGEVDSRVVPVPNLGGLPFREENFEKSAPSEIMKGKDPVAKILRVLMGMGEDDVRPAGRLTGNEGGAGQRLNEDQRVAHQLFLDDEVRTLFQQAPAGTGKSVSAAASIADLLKKDPKAVVLAVSPLNVAVCELVKDTMEALGNEKAPMLALFSGQGKGKYMDRIRPLGDNLLVQAVQRDGNIPGPPERKWDSNKTYKKYVQDFEEAPRRARERAAAGDLLDHNKYRVYFMTLALAEELALDWGAVSHMIVDECGQASLAAIISTLSQFRAVRKILLTGDKQQLRVHLPSQMVSVRGKFGFESVLEVLERARGIDRTVLSKCYRSHSAIVRSLDMGVYRPAGDKLVAARPDNEMGMFLSFMGPRIVTADCPIVLVHQPSAMQAENVSFSSHNPQHRETALGFLGIIQGTFPGLIQVVCFYQAERKQMAMAIENRHWNNVKVGTVDSIQSQEADLVLVLTTRTRAGRAVGAEAGKEFWADSARTTVALSRPRFGLVVIGDITLLWHKGTVWRKFVDEALRMTTVVTPEYVNLIANPWPQRSGPTIARGDGMVPMAYEFYADRDLIAQDECRAQGGMGINMVGVPFVSTGGPVAFTGQAFPPISAPTAVGPRGPVFFNSTIRPPMIRAESRPSVIHHPRVGPSARTTPYPQQHPPARASFASAAQRGQSNSNVGRRPEVICYRCRKIGHTQRFCRT
uniref:CCHC-type domain-containing protein n=1 Tax=Globodera rostochiensis TaxID=31243 RepID=A0A914HRG0_GLORO